MTQMELRTTDKKIRRKNWEPHQWVQWDWEKGMYINNDSHRAYPGFFDPAEWEYYEEPKTKRKIELEEWVCVTNCVTYQAGHLRWFKKGECPSSTILDWRPTGAQIRVVEIEVEE